MKAFLIVMSVLCVAGIALLIYAMIQETKSCEARGGKMEGNGQHYTVMSTVNNVTTIYTYEEMECTK
ncbi:hypothetical protein [Priestia megaterium]|uniref:hypothetical protein n=1 Tax=Priestia megaterium TaxID=1404 RepID=UPI00285DCFCC|nr:hypothetical protein [Priestia megaterium]MDR7207582.1 hypothetical protein [Priestia megaterium]